MRAAALDGPQALMPASAKASAMPATSGASGAITTKSIFSRCARATWPSMSSAPTSTHSATCAMPALPGAQ